MSPSGADWRLPGTRTARRAAIYGTAAKVAARYAAGRLPRPARMSMARAHRAGARDIYTTAVRLRGGFLKFGQFVSARPDLLPEPYIRELSKLQDRVPPAPLEAVQRVIQQQLGPIETHFREFDPAASAASLAQVHRAVRHDGRVVAVKVQYPGAAEIVPPETADTRRLLTLLGRFVQGLDLGTIAGELERVVLSELDYAHEVANIERFRAAFAGDAGIVVPAVHHDLCTDRVIVMDWVDGQNLGEALRVCDRDTAEEAVRLLVDAFLKQILVDGFVHADPHPGNFLLQAPAARPRGAAHPTGSAGPTRAACPGGPRLGIVDFGACAALSDATRLALADLYASGLDGDLARSASALDALGFRTRSGDVGSLVAWASLFDSGATEEDREAAWSGLVSAARADPLVRLPEELIMVGRVLIVQTGLVARLKPSWSMQELIARRLTESHCSADPTSVPSVDIGGQQGAPDRGLGDE